MCKWQVIVEELAAGLPETSGELYIVLEDNWFTRIRIRYGIQYDIHPNDSQELLTNAFLLTNEKYSTEHAYMAQIRTKLRDGLATYFRRKKAEAKLFIPFPIADSGDVKDIDEDWNRTTIQTIEQAANEREMVEIINDMTERMTEREKEITKLTFLGLTQREISGIMSISQTTVHRHFASLRDYYDEKKFGDIREYFT